MGSTILRVVTSRYRLCAFPRSLAWNSAMVGLTGGDRGEDAAQNDQHDGHRGPPADVPPAAGIRLLAEFRVLRAETLELSLLVLAGPGRGRLVPGGLGRRPGRFGLVRLIFTGRRRSPPPGRWCRA
jgi:hypothetical protein